MKTLRFVVVICLLSFGPVGCGAIDSFFMPALQGSARDMLMAGNEAMQEKEYGKAIKYYKKLKESYPFSDYMELAEMGLADAYFFDGKYTAAEEAYKEFESLHPGHKYIGYVLLQVGVSNLKQFKSIDLPMDHMAEAREYFQRVRELFPESSYAARAGQYLKKCNRIQAKHEIFVADFYQRRGKYLSAWKRYEFVKRHYSAFDDLQEYVSRQSRAAYLKYQQSRSKQEHVQRQGSWKQWFEWL
ncbi:MAG: outer membrane protein assembly factor BamD [Desulfohalobiaceae bacterium]|nr:outer membrane protein assembly factor BamD [Desulfohalobiaceae bacterium]